MRVSQGESTAGPPPSELQPAGYEQPQPATSALDRTYPWEPLPDPTAKDYIDRAREAGNEKRYQDMLAICADAEKSKITHPRLIVAKSAALVGLKRYDEAQDLLERSLHIYPDDPSLHYNLALVYQRKRLLTEATQEATRVLELLQGVELDERLSITMSGTLMILDRSAEAIEYLELETGRFPENSQLCAQLAVAYAHRSAALKELKRYDEAQDLLERSLQEFPESAVLHYLLATVYGSKRLRKEARQEAMRVLELLQGVNPNEIDEDLSIVITGALLILHRSKEATSYLEYETARFPDNTALRVHLGVAYANRGHWIKALREAKLLPEEQRHRVRKWAIISAVILIVLYSVLVGLFIMSIINSAFDYPFIILAALLIIWMVWTTLKRSPMRIRNQATDVHGNGHEN